MENAIGNWKFQIMGKNYTHRVCDSLVYTNLDHTPGVNFEITNMNNQIQKVFIEVRGATGGDEAKIWASDLFRMYFRFATKKGWKSTQLSDDTLQIEGPGVLDALINESGVHRVQRVPATEKRGRVHTSTATVAVLPEIKEHEVSINPSDLDWQFYRASTQGGQNVQKVSTAVRLIHKPSGIVVTSQ